MGGVGGVLPSRIRSQGRSPRFSAIHRLPKRPLPIHVQVRLEEIELSDTGQEKLVVESLPAEELTSLVSQTVTRRHDYGLEHHQRNDSQACVEDR